MTVTYDGEICDDCARAVVSGIGTWWTADDSLWNAIVPLTNPTTTLCPSCFADRARAHGALIYFKAYEWSDTRPPPAADRIEALEAALRTTHEYLLQAEQAVILANNTSPNWREEPKGIRPIATAIHITRKALRGAS